MIDLLSLWLYEHSYIASRIRHAHIQGIVNNMAIDPEVFLYGKHGKGKGQYQKQHIAVLDKRVYSFSVWSQGFIKFNDHDTAIEYAQGIADNEAIVLLPFSEFESIYPNYWQWDNQ